MKTKFENYRKKGQSSDGGFEPAVGAKQINGLRDICVTHWRFQNPFMLYDPDFERQMKLVEEIMHDDRGILRALAKWPLGDGFART
ncbi:hypothetical protein KQH49_04245 [Mycetohabitans sp. B5]|nr:MULTISPECIES: hypothetical protein [Mycetohabitans]MCG1054213.1 hypothetical protein [Mycetohabitans sp. B5]